MTGTFETVVFEKDGAVATITLNRPDKINAYNIQMRDDLWEVLSAIQADDEIRGVVIHGAGERGFCAGADLTEFGTAPSQAAARMARWERDVFGLLAGLRPPTVAALHGHVIGSGVETALLCDIRVASSDARFAMPETGYGLVAAATGTQTLPRHLRQGRAIDLLLTGREIGAAEALEIGLVQRIVGRDNLAPYSAAMAGQLAQLDPSAAAGVRRCVKAAMDGPLAAGLATESRIAGQIASRTRA